MDAGIRHARLAHGRRGGGRGRRRRHGRLRRRLHRRQQPDPGLAGRVPGQPRSDEGPSLSQRRRARAVIPTFREVGREAGLEPRRLDHGLGASFLDFDGDGRLDLYVANDLDPNRLYRNTRTQGGLGFRFVDVGRAERVADPNAGMGVAIGDYSGDGLDDVFVTNSRGQLHAAYRARDEMPFADARPAFARALGQRFTGWGATWVDLDLDGSLELAIANGAIPVRSLAEDAEGLQVVTTGSDTVRPLDVGVVGARNGRGLAAADYDNDGDLDLAVGSIGGALQLLRNDGAPGTGSRSRCRASRRARASP